MKKVIKKLKFKHGQWFSAEIKGIKCWGKISIDPDGEVFLCQNVQNGCEAENNLGFEYSWTLDRGTPDEIEENQVTELKLLSRKPAGVFIPKTLPAIDDFKTILVNHETIKVGCTPVSKDLYLEIGRLAGWIE